VCVLMNKSKTVWSIAILTSRPSSTWFNYQTGALRPWRKTRNYRQKGKSELFFCMNWKIHDRYKTTDDGTTTWLKKIDRTDLTMLIMLLHAAWPVPWWEVDIDFHPPAWTIVIVLWNKLPNTNLRKIRVPIRQMEETIFRTRDCTPKQM